MLADFLRNASVLAWDKHLSGNYIIFRVCLGWAASSEKVSSNIRSIRRIRSFSAYESIILILALHSYILKYPIILLADSIGSDQMSSLLHRGYNNLRIHPLQRGLGV